MDGHEYEHLCAKYLSCIGYTHVHVTQGSGDQGVDVVATRNGEQVAFQCKLWAKPVSNKAVQEVYAGMRLYGCTKAAVITNSSFTPGAEELARANDVVLLARRTPEMMCEVIRDAGMEVPTYTSTYLATDVKNQQSYTTVPRTNGKSNTNYNQRSAEIVKFPTFYDGKVYLTKRKVASKDKITDIRSQKSTSVKSIIRKTRKAGRSALVSFLLLFFLTILGSSWNNEAFIAIVSLIYTVLDFAFWIYLGQWIYYSVLLGRYKKAQRKGWIQ